MLLTLALHRRPQKISAEFDNRFDRHQLRDRWHGQAAQRGSRNVGRWSAEEDQKLREVCGSREGNALARGSTRCQGRLSCLRYQVEYTLLVFC